MVWDQLDYEVGLERGVFYLPSGPGVAWNGLSLVEESYSDSEASVRYIDGVRSNQRRQGSYFTGTIEAYTYPEPFYEDILVQRRPKNFGMSYRTTNLGSYKIHLVYNIQISLGGISRKQSKIDPFRWSFTALPVAIPSGRQTAHLIIDGDTSYSSTIEDLENILYGSDLSDPRLPLPSELYNIVEANSILRIIDNGDGTWTAIGPDEVITMLDSETFQIDWPSAVYLDANTYAISSL